MNIAFIVDAFPSLSTTFILNQITGLIDKGHEVKIFTYYKSQEKIVHQDVETYQLMNRIHYFDVPQIKTMRIIKAISLLASHFHKAPIKILKLLNIFKFRKLEGLLELTHIYAIMPFLKEEFDIIHCHFGPNGNLGAIFKQVGIKSKLVVSFHGYDVRLAMKKGERIYKRVFKLADVITANSFYTHNVLLDFGAVPERLLTLPCGIFLDRYPYRWESQTHKNTKRIIIISVGRLVEEKGLRYGIRAVHKLLAEKPELPVEYHIIGGGPLENELKELADDLNLNKVVVFHGPMEHEGVIKNLQKAQIFLFPSLIEMLGVAPMEAQAVGLPVVATEVGALSEVVMDGRSGFLVPPKDTNSLAEKLEYLIEHPEAWPEMGRSGRKHVEENYDIDILNNRLIEIYKDLVKQRA